MKRLKFTGYDSNRNYDLIFIDLDSKIEYIISNSQDLFNSFPGQIFMSFGTEDEYRMNGKLHREDGPAIIHYTDNSKQTINYAEYCFNGEYYSADEWLTKISKENRIKYLFNLQEY